MYLAREKTLQDVPEDLMKILGHCVQVMQLNLAKRDKLASQDIELVKKNLQSQGYHFQMPPKSESGLIKYGV